MCGLSFASACEDDDEVTVNQGGSGGGAGSGVSGLAGNAGMAGTGGTGGMQGDGPSGTIQVLSADAARLNTPTTAAIRGDDLWVANGQLTGLFGGAAAVPPFNVVSIPLAGGDVGDTDIVLPGNDFYPEGVAAAPDGTLYVGSFNLGTIVRIPADSTTPDAARLRRSDCVPTRRDWLDRGSGSRPVVVL